jgi:hypothetical protein
MLGVYLSGPINSDVGDGMSVEEHQAAFSDLKAWLKRNMGHWEVVNPCEVGTTCEQLDCGPFDGHSFGCWLKADLRAMFECGAICYLPGADRSRGARLEGHVARELGMIEYWALPINTGWIIR